MSRAPDLLAIPTGHRPASLQRTLFSFARDFAKHGRTAAIAVFHSARNAEEQRTVQDAVSAAGVDARYIGLAEKVALAKVLRRATGVDTAVLETALFNPERHAVSTGANRNACLLWSAGRRALHTDDDTVAALHCHPEIDPGAFDGEVTTGDAADYIVPGDGNLQRFAIADGDPRMPPGGVLGVLATAWTRFPSAPLAFFGLAGDCGWGAPFGFWGEAGLGYLLLPERALARLASDGRIWRASLVRRDLLRCAERLRRSRGGTGMTTCVGIDGTAPLPPFFPVARGQDALFSALVERLVDQPSLQLPYAISHAPLEARRFHADELLRSAASLDCARAMFALLEDLPPGSDLVGLGRYLVEIGRLSPAAFADKLLASHAARMRRLLASARQRAATAPQLSSEWHHDLEAYCSRVEETLHTPAPPWIVDAGGDDSDASRERLRTQIARYGDLCIAWPTLWRAASAVDRAASSPAPVSFRRLPRASPYQQWMWRAHQLDPRDPAYVLFRAYAGTGELDAERLQAALRLLLGRHDGLRSRFSSHGDELVLEVIPADAFILRRERLTTRAELDKLRASEARRPFDLTRELPLAVTLVESADAPGHWELWLRVHHIVWDGVSEGIFWRELEVIESNLAAGRDGSVGLPELTSSYAEVAAAQHAALAPLLPRAEAYWRAMLTPPPAELPLSQRIAVPGESARAHRVVATLPTVLAQSLMELARERRTTVAALCLAAWQGLLARFSGESDVTVAVNVANRWSESEERHIGLFMTLLPRRAHVDATLTLADLAVANQRALSDGYEAARLPYEKLVAAVSQGRRRFSLFQALFTHFRRSRAPTIAGCALAELRSEHAHLAVDIGLTVEENDEGFFIVLAGNERVFENRELGAMASALQSALADACRAPATPLVALDWLGADRALLAAWNATAVDYPKDQAMPDLLRQRAVARGGAIALSRGGSTISYTELFQRADALAGHLRALGVRRDVPVGVFLDRDPRLLETLLGIWSAGGAYVPLDPSFPRERLTFMLEDCGAPVIVTRRALLAELPPHRARVVRVDELPATPSARPADRADATADSLAYILYTSGSTGKPKGVEVPHRALVNFLCSMAQAPGLREDDVLLALTTISFDIAALELWLPLLVGARIELAGREEAADGKLLMAALARSGATAVQSTPSTWRALFGAGFAGDQRLKAMVGGEALPGDLAALLAERCGEAWNLYGPTETTVWSAAWRIPRATPQPVRIGRPIANTVIRVADADLRELPIGVVGELVIGGDGLAVGYRGREQLTAERFVRDAGGVRFYRTGDRGRWTREGLLECLGRTDDQIKLRGFRMEPGEIEAALLALPEVERAAVAAAPGADGEPRLVAWVVPRPGASLGATSEVRARLRAWLPEYMVPYHVLGVAALPLTPNGKVDRRALVAGFVPPSEPKTSSGAGEAPSADEAAIIAEFEALLGRKVGLDSDFFESGGDSLAAIRLIGRLAATHTVAPTTGDLFLHATPRALARFLRAPEAPRKGHLIPLRHGGVAPALALMHPIGGQLAAYGPLTVHLGEQMPVYGLLAATSDERRYGSIVERCARYVDELEAAVRGPLVLGGYSLGGVLAMQCALELARRGRAPPLLVLFDTWAPRLPRKLAEKLLFRAAELKRFTWSERLRWAQVQLMQRLTPRDSGVEEELPMIDWSASEELGRQALEWTPTRYPGPVLLFRAERDVRGYSVRAGGLGWEPHCPALRLVSMQCDHTQLMRDPQAAIMARTIVESLSGLSEPYAAQPSSPGRY